MKLQCPACSADPFEGDTELAVTLSLVCHLKDNPDKAHQEKLANELENLDRVVTFASLQARDDISIRQAIYDKCARYDTRLKTAHLYALTHLALAVQFARDILFECGEQVALRDKKAGQKLLSNLRDALRIAETKYRQ